MTTVDKKPPNKAEQCDSLPWIEKYRPTNLDEVISHDGKIDVLKKLIDKRQLPHLLFYGSPGTGKCLAKGTLVRMYDSSLRKVEELKVGDELMGDDLGARRILSTCYGTEKLYKIEQSEGIDYVVNEPHIITLRNKQNTNCFDICLMDYIKQEEKWKQQHAGYRLVIEDNSIKGHVLSDIKVECIGEGEYYGFTLNGNGRFLLQDCTVTHNTSSILALARQMYGPNYKRYILELNASDDRGIDIVRNKIPIFARTKSDDMRLVILDEADAMTGDAQSALRRIMELYIKNCRFCLICNNINKIIPGIQSRCAKMRFGVLDSNAIRRKLAEIVEEEGIEVEAAAVDQLLEIHQDFRQILNTLQCLRSIKFGETITAKDVVEYLGKANNQMVKDIINILNTKSFKKAFDYLLNLHRDNRVDMIDLVGHLVRYTIDRDDITELTRSQIIEGLATVEYRMITGSDTEIQLASLIGHMIAHR